MKKCAFIFLALLLCVPCFGAGVRLVVLDFENDTGMKPDAFLGGAVDVDAFTQKGLLLLTEKLLAATSYTIVDRREFVRQLDQVASTQDPSDSPRTSFIHAAQQLNADAVLRGRLLSLSTGKRQVNPDTRQQPVDFSTISLRVMVQALDPVDGTVLASSQGTVAQQYRQSVTEKTFLGEEELLQMYQMAIDKLMPLLLEGLSQKMKTVAERERVSVSIETNDDPALVELDGLLVGVTPMQNLQVYKGDHTLRISRPGYVAMTKRLVLDKDFKICVPMLRTDLSADERKEILNKAEMKAYLMDGQPHMIIHAIE